MEINRTASSRYELLHVVCDDGGDDIGEEQWQYEHYST